MSDANTYGKSKKNHHIGTAYTQKVVQLERTYSLLLPLHMLHFWAYLSDARLGFFFRL